MAQVTREQMREWQRQAAPGDGVRGWFDRGAWSATGQREPWLFSWARAVRFAVLSIVLMTVLVVLGPADVPALAGLTIAVVLMVWRANQLHQRYVTAHGSAPAGPTP